jgi:recombination protein RecT
MPPRATNANASSAADLATQVKARAASAAATPTKTPGAQLDRREANLRTLRGEIDTMSGEFQKAMPKGFEAAQLVRDAHTALRKTPLLGECDVQSVLGALMTIAQLGLRPHVLGQAYVLPFFNHEQRRYYGQFVIGYPGIVELGFRSTIVADIGFRPVCEGEIFDIDYGSDGKIVHKPVVRGLPGEEYGYYAIVRYANGGSSWCYMTREQAQAHRDKYATSRNKKGEIVGPWRDHFGAMAGKTTLLKLAKTMPKGRELATGIAADEGLRLDLNPKSDPAAVTLGLDVFDGEVVIRPDRDSTDRDDESPAEPPTE